jgi:hypothetical protein
MITGFGRQISLGVASTPAKRDYWRAYIPPNHPFQTFSHPANWRETPTLLRRDPQQLPIRPPVHLGEVQLARRRRDDVEFARQRGAHSVAV